MSEQVNIKEIIKQEYVKCATDPVHFFRKYCYIQHPIKGKINFHLYPFQVDTLSKFHSNRFVIINKSRQLGISTLVAGYALWLMLFNKNKTVLCIATKQETAKQMVDKVQFMYQSLPTWIKGPLKPLSDNKLSLELANGSKIIATSAASDAGRSYAVSLLIIDEAAFIEGIDKIYTSIKPTIATGGGIIALSTPNGIGNWFHQTYTKIKPNDFYPIELKWDLHPDRVAPIDPGWEERERANMSPREFAQEYNCDFLGSGNSVVDPEILTFYEQTYILEPIERRFMGGDFWIWKYPDYTKPYIVCADVARGDGSDNSAFHIIDAESCEQVAEYRSQIDTRTFGNMLVSVATEWNNALLVVENANIGWDVINTIIEKGYQNLYHSPRAYSMDEMNLDKWMSKIDNAQTIPGFTTSIKTRPLVISKTEAYIRDRHFIFHSRRLLEELRVFIWHNGKAQAQNGYNDDLVMALGIGLFTRDTGIKLNKQGIETTRLSIDNISKTGESNEIIIPIGIQNPYKIITPYGVEDLTCFL